MYFDKTAAIERLIEQAGDDLKEDYAPVDSLQGFPVNVQPANAETVALANGIMGKTYTMFSKTLGVKDGDRVTISGSWIDGVTQNKKIEVSNVGNWNFYPLPHYEITCVEIEQ